MKTLTAAQMREADRRCIEELGMPGAVLMNSAGEAVFRHLRGGPVGIVCGKGNNGGDGFVVARLALLAGYAPRVILVAELEELQGDAAVFMNVYRNLGGIIEVVPHAEAAAEAVQGLKDCAMLVDALLGTGISGEVRGPIRAAIEAWPETPTIAVDLPSGMNADTGAPCGVCVRASVTVSFAFAKQGFTSPQAAPWLGELHIADIGIPSLCGDEDSWRVFCTAMNSGDAPA